MLSQISNVFSEYNHPDKVHTKCPPGNYLVQFHPMKGYYLTKTEDFTLPEKIYGDTSHIDRWLYTFNNTNRNLGILLQGLKGAGKTLDAKLFCKKSNRPVIFIDKPYHDSGFFNMLENPAFHGAILFFDEFEKVYNSSELQNPLLSLFDGMFNTKLIFLMTVNDPSISDFFFNRPSRVRYTKSYSDMSYDIIRNICEDKLQNREHTESIIDFFSTVGMRSMDLLIEIINEVNLFNEPATVCGQHFNLKTAPSRYEAQIKFFNGVIASAYNITFNAREKHSPMFNIFFSKEEERERLVNDLYQIYKDETKMDKMFNLNSLIFDSYKNTKESMKEEVQNEKDDNSGKDLSENNLKHILLREFSDYIGTTSLYFNKTNSIISRNQEKVIVDSPLFKAELVPYENSYSIFNTGD